MNTEGVSFLSREDSTNETSTTHFRLMYVGAFLITLFLFLYIFLIASPLSFPKKSTVTIEEGNSLREIAFKLREQNVIRSALTFEFLIRAIPGTHPVRYGDYYLGRRLNAFGVASRVLRGKFDLLSLKITIPEGLSVTETARRFEEQFSRFNSEKFEELALKDEGYLFPDTYFFLPNVKEDQVYRDMKDNFNAHIEMVLDDIEKSGRTLREVVIMASLLEEEARTTETRKTIAGILWKRLSIGMALQVDSVFLYINGKNTFDLTLEDLAIDSPYNTYKYPGLPPGPITNPGMDAIQAALHPIESPYFYFLSDREGNVYYSRTFEEHKKKKELYL